MKYITKNTEPDELIKWKRRKKPTVKNYKSLNEEIKKSNHAKDAKEAIRASLLEEQGYLCCYCEQRVTTKSEKGHIEHFKPQSRYLLDTLNYDNLLYSCNSNNSCGHKKQGWYEATLLISPLEGCCEERFKFDQFGRVEAKIRTDNAASETIKQLGLDARKLIASRKAVIDTFIYLKKHEQKIYFEEKLKMKDGKYSPFWTTIDQLAKTLKY